MFIALETNLLSAAILPVSFWTSLTVLGDAMSRMAITFSRFAFILLDELLFGIHVQLVLDNFWGYTRHVLVAPYEDVEVFLKELNVH